MTTANTKFDPKRPGESELFGIDFKRVLSNGETIIGGSVEVELKSGIQHSMTSMIAGSLQISGTKVLQMIGGGIAGNRYFVRFAITTSLDQRIEIVGELLISD